MTVKVFRSTDVSSPQFSGDTINVNRIKKIFKACLVDGYPGKTSLGWTVDYTGSIGTNDENAMVFKAVGDFFVHLDHSTNPSVSYVYCYEAGSAGSYTLPLEAQNGYGATIAKNDGTISTSVSTRSCITRNEDDDWVLIGDENTFIFIARYNGDFFTLGYYGRFTPEFPLIQLNPVCYFGEHATTGDNPFNTGSPLQSFDQVNPQSPSFLVRLGEDTKGKRHGKGCSLFTGDSPNSFFSQVYSYIPQRTVELHPINIIGIGSLLDGVGHYGKLKCIHGVKSGYTSTGSPEFGDFQEFNGAVGSAHEGKTFMMVNVYNDGVLALEISDTW